MLIKIFIINIKEELPMTVYVHGVPTNADRKGQNAYNFR